MHRPEPPFVKKGDPITKKVFDQMGVAVRACRILAGPGTRLIYTPQGTIVCFERAQSFSCAWQVSLRGSTGATLLPGTINKLPATIGGVPLDGGSAGLPPPVLQWSRLKLDSEGRGWICAEATFDPAKSWAVVKVEIVQVGDPDTDDGSALPAGQLANAAGGASPLSGNRARHPLAMLRQRTSGQLDVYQVTCFDLQHRVALAKDQKTATRHFFW